MVATADVRSTRSPTAATRSPLTPTSARIAGVPVPSSTRPPRTTRSNSAGAARQLHATTHASTAASAARPRHRRRAERARIRTGFRLGTTRADGRPSCARIPGVPANPRRRSATVVETACPLDCPDACSLDGDGRGRAGRQGRRRPRRNPITDGFICGKVRRFPDHLYGDRPVAAPARARRRQGRGRVRARDLGRGARPRSPRSSPSVRDATSAARRSCRTHYGGSNGLLTQDAHRRRAVPAARRVAARAHGLRGADRPRRRTGLYGKMPGVAFADYAARAADRRLGRATRRPPASTWCRSSQRARERRREARRRRPAPHAAGPAGRPAPRAAAGHRPAGRAGHRSAGCSSSGRADLGFLRAARDRRRRAARARRAVDARARRPRWPGSPAAAARGASCELYADALAGGDPLRLGPRAQPQRRLGGGGGPRAAGRGRQVRRARRRLHAEQRRRLEARRRGGDRRARDRDARRST